VFQDADGSGAAEQGEAGVAQALVFADLNGDGVANAAEPVALTSATGRYELAGLPAGVVRLCWRLPIDQVHTLPRCQTVSVAPSVTITGVDFGVTAAKSWCSGGAVTATAYGIATGSDPLNYQSPNRAPGPATGAWVGTRLQVSPVPKVFVGVGERVATALLLADVDVGVSPNLTIRYLYQSGFQQALSATATDGRVASWLTTTSLPVPVPATFTVVDWNGELFIYNVPLDGSGRYQDVTVITQATRPTTWLSTKASIAGNVVDGRLVGVANTCSDTALFTVLGEGAAPPPTPTPTPGALPTATPVTTPPVTRPDLRLVAIDSPDPVVVSRTLTYRLTVRNDGPAVASGGVVVVLALPDSVDFLSAYGTNTFQCQPNGPGIVQCSGASITAGGSVSLTITGRVVGAASPIVARATVDPNNVINEHNEANNTLLIETTVVGP
jgi:uncharacterized repeat protein (TIGR01451 family)